MAAGMGAAALKLAETAERARHYPTCSKAQAETQ